MSDPTCLEECVEVFLDRLRRGRRNVALTGAGVSTASGIPDFRGPSGLYSKLSQRVFEIDFFYEQPRKYYQIAIEHIHTLADREPNITHRMLADLERQGLIEAVVTQNIDGLHQKAGTRRVIEFHGDVLRYRCTECHKEYGRPAVDAMIRTDGLPNCDCGSLIRPGIVFFGDPIPMEALIESQKLAQSADVFVAMGSSLAVNPAAGLAMAAHQAGATLIIINKGRTHYDRVADQRFDVDLSEFSQAVTDRLAMSHTK
ncbi:MAG: NAD-dependent protein deacylase [Sedimentisphaerales bacterium]|nr:NAD-dependent protein deacylase [Sedimentisphaerales bacterium]